MKKIALITGSSRGIGAATAIKFAEHGYDVGVNYLNNEEQANSIVDRIQSMGQRAVAIKADVSKEDEILTLFSILDESLGTVTVLVNNAAVMLPQTKLIDMSFERINQMLTTNVTGTFICSREAIKRMIQSKQENCSIVNVSSLAAKYGSANEYIDYAASKGAVDSMTIGLAKELAQDNIRVNAVRPGFTDTEIHAAGGEPNRIDRIKSNIPVNRAGTPEEIANAIYWLCSEESSYVTGALMDVGGGL